MQRRERQRRLSLHARRFEHGHPFSGSANQVEESRLSGARLADQYRCAAAAIPSVVNKIQQSMLLTRPALKRRALLREAGHRHGPQVGAEETLVRGPTISRAQSDHPSWSVDGDDGTKALIETPATARLVNLLLSTHKENPVEPGNVYLVGAKEGRS
jgi:hypothetical protein